MDESEGTVAEEHVDDMPALSGPGVICYNPMMITTSGIWQGSDPLLFSLPLFILQMSVIVLLTRVLVLLLKPFHQPRVIAEILAGILLGPSVIGQLSFWPTTIFPARSLLTLETVAHLGLLYFLFLVGVEMDVAVIQRSGHKAVAVAVAGMALPFGIGTAASYLLKSQMPPSVSQAAFLLFISVALAVTAFPVLARILAETKLLTSELGRLAMSAAIVNDICAWMILALAIAVSEKNSTALSSLWVLLAMLGFVLFCFFAVRPAMHWLVHRMPEGEGVSDFAMCIILTGVMLSGLATDAIGVHSIFGAFVFGLVMPNGPLGVAIIEKLEDFVTGLLLPLYFAISGLRTDLTKISDRYIVAVLVLVFVLAGVAKILGTLIVAAFYSMPFRDGVALGFMMNTRGLIEMIVLNIGRDKKVLDDESYAVMVVMSVVMTSLVTPVVTVVHRPARRLVGYKRRNLQRSKPDSELRMLACVHTTRNVPSVVSLLELSNPTKRAPIFVYALYLVELTGRASNMIAANSTLHRRVPIGLRNSTDSIFSAFETYEQHAGGVSIQTLSAMSPYDSMHEDVVILAEDKHVSLIVIPFHKQQTVDGCMEPINPAIQTFNDNLLATAPCSVAILVDRGLSASMARVAAKHHVALLYFGGPDDREGLAYAWRIIENPGVSLTVVRFLQSADAAGAAPAPRQKNCSNANDTRMITIVTDSERERLLDDEYLNDFRARNSGNEEIVYVEKVVSNSEEMVTAIRNLESVHDLYIVGRRPGAAAAALTTALAEFMECQELGPIGDLLVSSDFSMMVSVLVVQQYVVGPGGALAGAAMENSDADVAGKQYVDNANLAAGSRVPPAAFGGLSAQRG